VETMTITKGQLSEVLEDMYLDKACSIKPFKDAEDSKTVTLRINFSNITIADVLEKAIRTAVISWQNGPGRKKYNSWTNGQVVGIAFSKPAQTIETPAETMRKAIRVAGTMSKEERLAYIKELESLDK